MPSHIRQTFLVLMCIAQRSCGIYLQMPPKNPCPDLFQYQIAGNEWHGFVHVPFALLSETIKLNVAFTLLTKLETSYPGQLSLFFTPTKTLQDIKQKRPIVFYIRFPTQSPLPIVDEIMVNYRIICSRPKESGRHSYVSTIGLEYTFYTNLPRSVFVDEEVLPRPHDVYNDPVFNIDIRSQPEISVSGGLDRDYLGETDIFKRKTAPVFDDVEQGRTPMFQQPMYTPSPDLQSTVDTECGRPASRFRFTPLVAGGKTIPHGSWPWLAAIYMSHVNGPTFQCAGNLVSPKVVVTVAHCFHAHESNNVYNTSGLFVYLGRSNIMKWSAKDSHVSDVENVYVHEDYLHRTVSSDADIAVVVMNERVAFSDYIRPICLWEGADSPNDIVGTSGTVVGWGFDSSSHGLTPDAQMIRLPIVSDGECLRSNDTYRYMTSNRTFCAGSRDGNGPCNGDSGSAMSIYKDQRLYLRGIVSTALADPVTNLCNLKAFVVLVDVAKFTTWIQSFM